MVDFGEGTGGKVVFERGMRYFRCKKPLIEGAHKIFQTFRAYVTILKVVMFIVDSFKPEKKNSHCSLNADETSSFLLKGRKN